MKRLIIGTALVLTTSLAFAQPVDVQKLRLERENIGLKMSILERNYGDLKQRADELDKQIKELEPPKPAQGPEAPAEPEKKQGKK